MAEQHDAHVLAWRQFCFLDWFNFALFFGTTRGRGLTGLLPPTT